MSDSFRRAYQLQAEAAAVGFDWPKLEGILDKTGEELAELREALKAGTSDNAVREELGDLLFVLVNLARRLNVAPDTALASACDKFERRFAHVRNTLAERGLQPEDVDLDALENLWQQAKRIERQHDN